ncbi:MAG: bifunctional (p)ppGpp synthetase/guanosine-3',5'-bis(diphosphate) 3'-pyrophosphohydrolase [Bacteroidales bacterium]|nr:bifunctional (p)ppGpp synthetase/guanosine-3',5'-bis(diphosphate) 3'-pyrophosphohydrolase [Candidatus Physcocola equi]
MATNTATVQTTNEEDAEIEAKYAELRELYLNSNHRKHIEIIDKAFKYAKQAHSGVRRRSGEPYIMHPIAVAKIVAEELGLGSTSICSALLHDVVEDTDTSVEDIKNMFNPRIALIVDGLTKISGGVFGTQASAQAENFRKLLLTMSEDIRVVLIKMADRLHNMRTLGSMPPAKQLKIAGETQYIYAPLANRLGLYAIKTELEDLSFKYEHPDKYDDLTKKVEATQKERDKLFNDVESPIRVKLEKMGLKAEIQSRVKSIYSIWRKMQNKGIPFEEIYDILAIRIVFDPVEGADEKAICWSIYSAVTDLYKPHPERIRDWVSTPKANGYEALHVTVMGPDGKWVEVQIRSRRMDDIAEKGFAAHWKYKTGENDDSELEKWLQTIKEQLKNPDSDAIDFIDNFKMNLFSSEIFVYTPKGEIKTMPKGATVLDFAFSLHTELGMQCIGAKINHKLVALNYELQSGDQVEILTSKRQQPSPEWIDNVKTAKGRACIKQLFRKEYTRLKLLGEKKLHDYLQKINVEEDADTVNRIIEHYGQPNKEEMMYKIGKGSIDLLELGQTMFKDKKSSRWVKIWNLTFGKLSLPGSDNEAQKGQKNAKKASKNTLKVTENNTNENGNGLKYRIAECCCPIPGDDILGFMEENGVYVVHKRSCGVAMRLKSSYGNRIVTAAWETHRVLSFPATIEVKGMDRVGILAEIISVISQQLKINIARLVVDTGDGLFTAQITVYIRDVEDVNNLCMNISKIRDINSVGRIETDKNVLNK